MIQFRERVRQQAEYLGFRFVIGIVQMMSFQQSRWASRQLAGLLTYVVPHKLSRFPVAAQNLRIAFGEQLTDEQCKNILCGMWEHLFRLVIEIAQSTRKLHLENCREVLVFRDRSQVLTAMAQGRPVIVLSGHFGNWEIAISTFGLFGYPMGVVARALDNPHVHDWFTRYREATGHRLVLKAGGSDEMMEFMQWGGSIGLLCDQDAGPKGVFVDFFGKPASTFKSIALLAMQYDAMLCMGYAIRVEDDLVDGRWSRFEIGVEDCIDPRECESNDVVREITEKYTQALERVVRTAPEQYFWVHRRWKTPVGQKRGIRKKQRRAKQEAAATT